LLLVSGFVITVNLEAVGGLMLFSLLVAPPAAACQLSRKYSNSVLLSVILGVAAAVGGLVLSYALDTPTGASIVVVAGGIFGASALLERKRRGAASRR